jgi:hypothetical protein
MPINAYTHGNPYAEGMDLLNHMTHSNNGKAFLPSRYPVMQPTYPF